MHASDCDSQRRLGAHGCRIKQRLVEVLATNYGWSASVNVDIYEASGAVRPTTVTIVHWSQRRRAQSSPSTSTISKIRRKLMVFKEKRMQNVERQVQDSNKRSTSALKSEEAMLYGGATVADPPNAVVLPTPWRHAATLVKRCARPASALVGRRSYHEALSTARPRGQRSRSTLPLRHRGSATVFHTQSSRAKSFLSRVLPCIIASCLLSKCST